ALEGSNHGLQPTGGRRYTRHHLGSRLQASLQGPLPRPRRGNQQAIGLAANALFGFTVPTRPVYWRLLVCQSMLYHALVRTRTQELLQPETTEDLVHLCGPVDEEAFPLGRAHPDSERFEPLATTVAAARTYIDEVVVPRTFRRLR